MPGKVFLVGAGPGDPGLMTRRGWDLIENADVLVVDDLVHPLFSHLNKIAPVIYVGKRGPASPRGRIQVLPQNKINQTLIRLARLGKRVVRLKGGDPLMFGRGGEEMEALRKARIEFEVVPGVSSVTAAPAFAGVPLSDRRWASSVTIITGQESRSEESVSKLAWNRIPRNGTLIILMGVQKWPQIQKTLLTQGWPPRTPVAVVESATGQAQRDYLTDLRSSQRFFTTKKIVSPAVIVVGSVAQLQKKLSWLRQAKPLLGQVVVVTRASSQNKSMVSQLQDLGAVVVECPAISISPLSLDSEVRLRLNQWKKGQRKYDWILFLSENAVQTFSASLGPVSKWPRTRVAVVGPATKSAVAAQGWPVDLIADQFNSRSLIKKLGNLKRKKILLPRVQNAPRDLSGLIRHSGGDLDEITTYENRPALPPPHQLKKFILEYADVITFTSASTVTSFQDFWTKHEFQKLFRRAQALSIGPSTSDALRALGIRKPLQAPESTVVSMIRTLTKRK